MAPTAINRMLTEIPISTFVPEGAGS
jgi:hypothetical protein